MVAREDYVGMTYEELCDSNVELRKVIDVLLYCMSDSGCDRCPLNGSTDEVTVDERTFDGCDGLIEAVRRVGLTIE